MGAAANTAMSTRTQKDAGAKCKRREREEEQYNE
jgi:hypothetical protein